MKQKYKLKLQKKKWCKVATCIDGYNCLKFICNTDALENIPSVAMDGHKLSLTMLSNAKTTNTRNHSEKPGSLKRYRIYKLQKLKKQTGTHERLPIIKNENTFDTPNEKQSAGVIKPEVHDRREAQQAKNYKETRMRARLLIYGCIQNDIILFSFFFFSHVIIIYFNVYFFYFLLLIIRFVFATL